MAEKKSHGRFSFPLEEIIHRGEMERDENCIAPTTGICWQRYKFNQRTETLDNMLSQHSNSIQK